MSDQAQTNNQQMIVYALVAIAVLLFVIVAYMIYNSSRQVPAPTASSTVSSADSAAANVAAQMPTETTAVEFDTKTATKLPSGMTPEKAVKQYNELVMAKKYDEAFELLPLAQKKAYGGTAEEYTAQISQYGITSYKIGKADKDGDNVMIVSEQNTPQINVTYTWTYTKVGKDWYANTRVPGGVVEE
jgi:hypothetical protein